MAKTTGHAEDDLQGDFELPNEYVEILDRATDCLPPNLREELFDTCKRAYKAGYIDGINQQMKNEASWLMNATKEQARGFARGLVRNLQSSR